MADLTLDASVTRTELSLSALDLVQDGIYDLVDGTGPGSSSWRREAATSPYMHGDAQVSAVLDVMRAPLVMRVYGSTHSQLDSRIADLLNAFSQFEYTLTLVIGGVTHQWLCNQADYAVGDGGAIDKFPMMVRQQIVHFEIPRQPIPLAGAY